MPVVYVTSTSRLSRRPKTTALSGLHNHVTKTTTVQLASKSGPSRLVYTRSPATHPGTGTHTACRADGNHAKENQTTRIRRLGRATNSPGSNGLLRIFYAPAGATPPQLDQVIIALLAFRKSPARLFCTLRTNDLVRLSYPRVTK